VQGSAERKSWLFGLKRRNVAGVRLKRRIQGVVRKAANIRFTTELAKQREGGSIPIEQPVIEQPVIEQPGPRATPTPLSQGSHMQVLSARHVKTEESLRLGVVSGWYSTKVSGTFVTGPHATQEECLSKIAELNPPPARRKF
jgi:hypothetical protein